MTYAKNHYLCIPIAKDSDNMNITRYCLIVWLSCLAVGCGGKQETQKAEPLRVKTETVSANQTTNERTYVGTVEEESSTSVSFVGTGTVQRVLVNEGQHVKKGQLVAQMDPTQCQNTLVSCEAQMRQANDALERMRQLHEAGSLADIKWVEVQSQVEQARSMLQMAKKALADCYLYAPVSGVVGKKMINAGETALTSQPVCTILSIGKVKVKASVPEKEIASISANTNSRIIIDALAKEFVGGRIEKGVEADAITHTYDIRISMENPGEEILPGMVASVQIRGDGDAGNLEGCISVPLTSVQQTAGGEKFVWLLRDGKAHRQQITLGESSQQRIIVNEGLKQGDKVITQGYQKVGEGTDVTE